MFIQICHAIQHAHQKGIIHRDIKPSNIIVTLHDGLPVPKVIDFGIAKATEAPLTDKTLLTMQNQFIGTPAYMSPEQAGTGGLDIDTRSDIYSLGVLLYELLTGKTPFDPKILLQSGVDEMRRTLRDDGTATPFRPVDGPCRQRSDHHRLRRHAEPPRLIALIRGDLDWIVMKALEKERARRYETANGLAMDIQRHLTNEPVMARPPSRIYRLQKLVRRNKVVFIATAAVSAALIAGMGTSTWLFLKEREARQRAVAAERQQTRLTQEAERARSNEAKLRLQAEARERITQADVLVSQGRFDEADKIIGEASPTETECGRRGGPAFFERMARPPRPMDTSGRIAFDLLLRANQLDGWDVNARLDFLGCGVCLIESGAAGSLRRVSPGGSVSFRFHHKRGWRGTNRQDLLAGISGKTMIESLAPLARLAEESFATADSHDTEAAFSGGLGIGFSGALGVSSGPLCQKYRVGQTLPGLSRIQCAQSSGRPRRTGPGSVSGRAEGRSAQGTQPGSSVH